MLAAFKSLLWYLVISSVRAETNLNKYYAERKLFIDNELEHGVGGRIKLSPAETIANEYLMQLKTEELDIAFKYPEKFKLSHSFLRNRQSIKHSKVYPIIKKMPKGALLHVHSSLIMDADYILKLTYEDHLYACYDGEDDFQFRFSDKVPNERCSNQWRLLNDIRGDYTHVEQFDEDLKKHFTLSYYEDDDINTIWRKFNKVYRNFKPLIKYRPVRERYWYDCLKKLYDDNVFYVEIRTGLHQLYELNGTQHDYMYMARLLQRISKEFSEEHPDFVAVKLILTNNRQRAPDNLGSDFQEAFSVKEEMPEFFAGVDLVGQEDLGKHLVDFLPALAKEKGLLNYYFHGGETNWYGTSTDENLIDAIFLGTKRIGHGYALLKHPALLEEVRRRNIAIEVNVISNEVLGLVHDVRNHPLSLYMALNLPVVISSDDPGVWYAEPLTDDFFVAFMGVASRRADLRTLKQLALNSITYSAMDSKMMTKALLLFARKWKTFIDIVNAEAERVGSFQDASDCQESCLLL